jgi:hypothetical protein
MPSRDLTAASSSTNFQIVTPRPRKPPRDVDPKHPEAEKAKKLHSFAAGAMAQALRLNLALDPDLMELANVIALNADAMRTLRVTLPKASGIKPTYVHADSSKANLALP